MDFHPIRTPVCDFLISLIVTVDLAPFVTSNWSKLLFSIGDTPFDALVLGDPLY